ncbi:SET and MYND domain-containing protein 4-like [Planococcus citri]|uniref:SET and MYND domain-containing protein 4-like n=1 Tax=Planococcus citri TaxID=170843 RepID=UPI0031F7653E
MADARAAPKTFKDYQLKFRSSLSNSQLQKFKNLKTVEEKITFVNGLENSPMYPINAQVNRGKDSETAKKLKEQGNGCFQKGKYNDAIRFYSQSILKAPQNGSESNQEMPVYFANRSAALYHLKEYTLALKDIDFAMANNYPKDLQHKLLDRKARCLLALEKFQKACEVFRKTIQALDDAKMPSEKRQKWQKDIQIMLLMLSKDQSSRKKDTTRSKISELKEIKNNTNSEYEALVPGIDIKFAPEMGRFAEAKQDIKAGKILLVEDPHSAVLLQKYQYTHCYHCFKRVKTLYPCPSCDQVIFCSQKCTSDALKYHRIECSILRTLWESEISITCHISLRIIAQHSLGFFLEKKDFLQKTEQPKEITHYKSSDYETVFHLVTHEERRKPEDILNRIHMALFLTKCLKVGGYFGEDCINEKLTNDEIFITKLLLHHLQVSQFNSHEISELRIKNHDLINSSSEFIGGAIYPTLALFNHSCNPGVIRYFDGTRVITRAIRNIRKGEMIAENYGPIFTETEKIERQRVLREQYWFECHCEACTNNWPTMSDMSHEENIRFRCTKKDCRSLILVNQNCDNFIAKCDACSENNNILKALKSLQETNEKFKMAQTLMRLEKVDDVLDIALPILNLLDETLVPPFKDYYLCAQIIRTCFLTKGNIYLENDGNLR